MGKTRVKPDWDPRSPEVKRDQRAAYDEMRENNPVAYSELMHWSVFRHEDVMRILLDHETFSNGVSRHLSVPNGMDPPQHTPYRRLIEKYFTPDYMAWFESVCREIVVDLIDEALEKGELELIADFARTFSVRVQCAFLGWPDGMYDPLMEWTLSNHQATFAQDRPAMAKVAAEFEAMIDTMLDAREDASPDQDITASLLHDRVGDRRLNRAEITSILRNWTVGEIGTITASIGIIVHYLAEHPELQTQLRENPDRLPEAIDEMLRLYNPLVASRRVTTRPVEIQGRKIDAGERITIMWMSANRDGRVFENPYEFSLDRDPSNNLLYGAGIHVCPGAPLARLEMRIVMEEMFRRTKKIELVPGHVPTHAVYPASGWKELHVRLS